MGRFSIYMDQDTIHPNSTLMASPTAVPIQGPALQFKLDVVKSNNPLSKDSQGKLVPQTISLGQVSNTPFKHPAFMEINLDGYADLKHIPAGQAVYVATYDETNSSGGSKCRSWRWTRMPTKSRFKRITSRPGERGWEIHSPARWCQCSLIRFSLHQSIYRRGPLQHPDLDTAGAQRDGAEHFTFLLQRPTVDGVLEMCRLRGWARAGNIDSVEIVRKITTSETGYGYLDNNAGPNEVQRLHLDHQWPTYNLLVDPNHPNRYYTQQEQGDFLYIDGITMRWVMQRIALVIRRITRQVSGGS